MSYESLAFSSTLGMRAPEDGRLLFEGEALPLPPGSELHAEGIFPPHLQILARRRLGEKRCDQQLRPC